MIRPYLLAWIGMLVIAFLNGAFREFVLVKWMTARVAGQVSTLLLLGAFAFLMFFVLRLWPAQSAAHAIGIGVLWLVLTLAFEFLFGHYVSHQPWSELIAAYDVVHGELWALIPAAVFVGPYLAYRTL